MVESHQTLLVQKLLDGFAVLSVHQHLNALGQKRAADLPAFEAQHALFPGYVGDLHQLLNAGLGFRQFEFEGAGGRFESPQKLRNAELGEHDEHGAAHNDQQRGRIDKYSR